MSLKVKKSFTRYIPRIIGGLCLLALAIFVIRVSVWENNYYNEKEGSERATPAGVGTLDDEEVSTEEVTDAQKAEYTVAPDMPRYLSIPKLDVYNARVFEVGTKPGGQMETPKTNYDVGWWNGSAKPGTGGTAIIDGHNGASVEGVFKRLPNLTAGDLIRIELGDGSVLTYRVYDNVTYSIKDANQKINTLSVSPVEGIESLSLITCTGEWSYNLKTFNSRQYLRATLTGRTSPTERTTGSSTMILNSTGTGNSIENGNV